MTGKELIYSNLFESAIKENTFVKNMFELDYNMNSFDEEYHTKNGCIYSIPIPVDRIISEITDNNISEADSKGKLIPFFVRLTLNQNITNELQQNQQILNSIKQTYIVIKLLYGDARNTIKESNLDLVWKMISESFYTSEFDGNVEEEKHQGKDAKLCSIIVRDTSSKFMSIVSADNTWYYMINGIESVGELYEMTKICKDNG